MEVKVLAAKGIPRDAYISIADGAQRVTRRATDAVQSAGGDGGDHPSGGKPYRLSQAVEEPSVLKVEVLTMSGSARLVRQPGEGKYTVSVPRSGGAAAGGSDEAFELSLGIAKSGAGGGSAGGEGKAKEGGGDAGKQAAPTAELQRYLDNHKLTGFLQAMVKGLLESKPDDPYAWMATQLASKCSENPKPMCEERKAPPSDGGACVVTGPSGVGKSTLIKKLMAEFSGKFGFSVSHTTREPRPGEQDGVDYHFVSKEKMEEDIKAGLFIEYAEVHGNYYGTSIAAVESVMKEGKVCLLDIDVQGADSVRRSSLAARTSFVFFAPPTVEVLEQRLRGRGTESEEAVQKRLGNSKKELAIYESDPAAWNFTLRWFNEDVEKAYAEFRRYLSQQIPGAEAPSAVPAPSALPMAEERRPPPASGGACVVTGPSGVGKSTLIKKLMAEFPGKFGFSVSHTSREPRPGEQNGVDYHFVSKEQIEQDIKAGLFIEYAEVHGNYYGTSIAAVESVMKEGKVCLLDIDVQGADSVRRSSLAARTSFVFFAPPTVEVLEQRLRGRGTESEEAVQKRLGNSKKELAIYESDPAAWNFTLRWFNEDVDKAYVEFRKFLSKQIQESEVPQAVRSGAPHLVVNASMRGAAFLNFGIAPSIMLI